jgi:hypothetical protein
MCDLAHRAASTLYLARNSALSQKNRARKLNPVLKKPRTQFDPENDFRAQLGTVD